MKEGDEDASLAQHLHFMSAFFFVEDGLLDLQHHIRMGEHILRVRVDRRPRPPVCIVRDMDPLPRPRLDDDSAAKVEIFLYGFGSGGDPFLPCENFLWNENQHDCLVD